MGQDSPTDRPHEAQPLGVLAIGAYHVVLAVALMVLLFVLWPERAADGGKGWRPTLAVGTPPIALGDDARLILIVLCAGALGSYVHSATSFASYVGNDRLRLRWAWWYVLRPFIGMALALIFYFVVRGGLLATSAAAHELSVFGVAAVAGLVGMFSKQATDKLRELFDSLFRITKGEGDDARADKLAANLPVRDRMIPRHKMVVCTLPESGDPKALKVVDLHRRIGGVVTRIPVLRRDDTMLCVIHQSLIYRFLAERGLEADADHPFDPREPTLEDFLRAPRMTELVQGSIAFVSVSAMLSDAKRLMEQTRNCQDVVVTEHGQPNEAVLGWLTDAEIRRAATI